MGKPIGLPITYSISLLSVVCEVLCNGPQNLRSTSSTADGQANRLCLQSSRSTVCSGVVPPSFNLHRLFLMPLLSWHRVGAEIAGEQTPQSSSMHASDEFAALLELRERHNQQIKDSSQWDLDVGATAHMVAP
jgi:hypothetical protein